MRHVYKEAGVPVWVDLHNPTPEEIAQACADCELRIPTREEHGSMNLGQSVAVCLYEIIRNPAAARERPGAKRAAKAEDSERLTQLLDKALSLSGYLHAGVEGSTRMKTRLLSALNRSRPSCSARITGAASALPLAATPLMPSMVSSKLSAVNRESASS